MNTTLLTCQETAEVEWRARLGLFRSVCGVPSGVFYVCALRGCYRAVSVCVPLGRFSVWRASGRFSVWCASGRFSCGVPPGGFLCGCLRAF